MLPGSQEKAWILQKIRKKPLTIFPTADILYKPL